MDITAYGAAKGFTERYTQPMHIFNECKHNIDLMSDEIDNEPYKIENFVPIKDAKNEVIITFTPKEYPEYQFTVNFSDDIPFLKLDEGKAIAVAEIDFGTLCIFVYEKVVIDGEFSEGVYLAGLLETIKHAIFEDAGRYIDCYVEFLCRSYKMIDDKYLNNPNKNFYIPFNLEGLDDLVAEETKIEVDEQFLMPLYDKIMNGNDYNFFALINLGDTVLPFLLEHVGIGFFKISILLNEIYFTLGLEEVSDSFTYLGQRKIQLNEEEENSSSYGLRKISLKDQILESLESRGLTQEWFKNKINNNSNNKLSELLSKLAKEV